MGLTKQQRIYKAQTGAKISLHHNSATCEARQLVPSHRAQILIKRPDSRAKFNNNYNNQAKNMRIEVGWADGLLRSSVSKRFSTKLPLEVQT